MLKHSLNLPDAALNQSLDQPVQFLYDKDLHHKRVESSKSIISYHNQRNSIRELPT